MAEQWRLRGTVYIACNCDWGCPCNFNAVPTQGYCEGGWTWSVEDGRYGGVALDRIRFGVHVKWPGPIHEGNGHAIILVDEQASDDQFQAVTALVGGDVGGPWGILGWTWPTVDGPHRAAFEITGDGVNFDITAGDYYTLRSEPIKNPVTGAESYPGAVLPQGIIVKEASFGSSTELSVRNGIKLDYAGKYTAVGAFDYSGP